MTCRDALFFCIGFVVGAGWIILKVVFWLLTEEDNQ